MKSYVQDGKCSSFIIMSSAAPLTIRKHDLDMKMYLFCSNHKYSFNFNFLLFNLIELPITMISEKAIAPAAIIGLSNPTAAIGMAITL